MFIFKTPWKHRELKMQTWAKYGLVWIIFTDLHRNNFV